MTAPSIITLIGYSGTGKSTVAALIAKRLGWRAVDLDVEIERTTGRTISDIFSRDGELAFRRLEGDALERAVLSQPEGVVIAAGGGIVLSDEARRLMASTGLVVCLEATVETIQARLRKAGDDDPAGTERPLIASGYPRAQIALFKARRAPMYAQADFTVHVDALTPQEVAVEVVRLYESYAERAFTRPGRVEALSARPAFVPEVIDAPGAATVVRTASADYPAYVAWGALEHLGEYTKRATGARKAFLISDTKVLEQWGETALSSLRTAGIEVTASAVPRGDGTKSLASAGKLYGWLAEQRAERRDVIVALGGGMVGDLAGFVAATYLRGMPVVQAPTSLLGMVDASIGGKTAVNHAGAKNLVGAFYQPRAVVADVATLKTLPRRELVEGLGEVIKHALILDEDLLETLESRLEDLLALNPELMTEVVRRNIRIKAGIVSEDERETGGRRELLNYGHTLGHAFEAAGEYSHLLHGEAVAVGMMAAAQIGVRMGVTPAALLERQGRLIERAGLPLTPPRSLERERVRQALAMDKKIVGGTQRWILLEAAGRPVIRDDVPPRVLSEVLDQLLG